MTRVGLGGNQRNKEGYLVLYVLQKWPITTLIIYISFMALYKFHGQAHSKQAHHTEIPSFAAKDEIIRVSKREYASLQ